MIDFDYVMGHQSMNAQKVHIFRRLTKGYYDAQNSDHQSKRG